MCQDCAEEGPRPAASPVEKADQLIAQFKHVVEQHDCGAILVIMVRAGDASADAACASNLSVPDQIKTLRRLLQRLEIA